MSIVEELKKLAGNPEAIGMEPFTERLRGASVSIQDEMMKKMEEMHRQMVPELVQAVMAQIRVPKDGRDGKDGKDGRTPSHNEMMAIMKMLVPKEKKDETGELKKMIAELGQRLTSIASRRGGGGGGGDTMIADDLSSQADGSTRTFTTTKRIGKPILVVSSQFPTVLRLTTDFTASNTTLTLSSSLDPIQTGQTLYFLYAEG